MSEFMQLIEQEIPRLRRYARALLRDAGRADDLVQSCLAPPIHYRNERSYRPMPLCAGATTDRRSQMTRVLTMAGATVLGFAVMSGSAFADPPGDYPYGESAAPALTTSGPELPKTAWRYELQYHYGRRGAWVPGWVAVRDN